MAKFKGKEKRKEPGHSTSVGLATVNEAQRSSPRSRKPKKFNKQMELQWDNSLLPLSDLQRPLQAELGGEAAASPEESISCSTVAQIWVHQEQLSHGRPWVWNRDESHVREIGRKCQEDHPTAASLGQENFHGVRISELQLWKSPLSTPVSPWQGVSAAHPGQASLRDRHRLYRC